MPQLRQLVIAAENPSQLAGFYRVVFELEKIEETKDAVFLSDGVFHLALVEEPDSRRRGLRQTSFETVRIENLAKKLAQAEFAESAVREVRSITGIDGEIRDPDGNTVGLCRRAFDTAFEARPVPIRHVALRTRQPEALARFYCKVFDMKEVERGEHSSIFVSDGTINLALLCAREEEPLGLNHFGFHVANHAEVTARAEKAGVPESTARLDRIAVAEYRLYDPEGNEIELSQKGWRV